MISGAWKNTFNPLPPGEGAPRRAGRGGYSLIELLIVISMLGVMFAFASWSIAGILPKWRLQGAANEVVMRIQQARAEAVRRGAPMVVSFTNVGVPATSGVSVLVDSNGDYVGDSVISQTIIPDSYKEAYVKTVRHGGGAFTTMAIGADGTIKSLNAGSKGTMPITITMDSAIATTPDTYLVIVDRAGVARVEAP